MKIFFAKYWVSILFGFITIVFIVLSIYISSQRPLSSLENTLLQFFSLLFGTIASFLVGKQSADKMAREIIKPHARSAFRRLMALYGSLSRAAAEIEKSNSPENPQSEAITLAKLEAIVIEQLATADHALEDWRDIIPEEVQQLTERLTSPRNQRPLE